MQAWSTTLCCYLESSAEQGVTEAYAIIVGQDYPARIFTAFINLEFLNSYFQFVQKLSVLMIILSIFMLYVFLINAKNG